MEQLYLSIVHGQMLIFRDMLTNEIISQLNIQVPISNVYKYDPFVKLVSMHYQMIRMSFDNDIVLINDIIKKDAFALISIN